MAEEPRKSQAFDINATSVFHSFEPGATPSTADATLTTPEAPGILCKTLSPSGSWQTKSFHQSKSFLRIGTSSSECDLCIPQAQAQGVAKIHVAARLVFDSWQILEYAAERSMTIDGIKRPQTILKNSDACILHVGGMDIALQSVPKKKVEEPFDPMKTMVSFKTKDREYKLGLDASALLGSDVECAIQSPAMPPIAGVAFAYRGRPYLWSAKAAGSLQVDGADASVEPRELRDGSVVSSGATSVFAIELKPPLELNSALPPPISEFKGSLVLQDITDHRFGPKLILPPAGRSIMIGRDQSNHFMLDSLSVSKKHAQIIIYDNSILVLDAHSTNGTYVEEEPIVKKLVHPGEIVRFADKSFILCFSE